MQDKVPESRIDALVRLLGDDDAKISAVAWENLENIGEQGLPFLERAARDSQDSRVRVQSERFLKEWGRREVFRRWVEFCRGGRLDLEEGAFLIASTEYPDIDMAPYRGALDGYAQVLRRRLEKTRTVDEGVKRVSSLLFGELGLKGNAAEYSNPENSYLNRVLDLRKGIPITLATLFLCIARRISLPVEGVGMPQHFLLKYRGASGEVFVDAFHGGKTFTARDCAAMLAEAQIPFRADHLRAVTDREMLARMLGNLLRVYLSLEDRRRYDRISAMLKLLE
jgi:regulator of sirC expression with transglutaminase-like and TPR domain